jgi:DNA-binding NtrC family response regulator
MEISRRPRVLVVEDEQTLARIYTRALVAAGYEVDQAPDGAEGLKRLLGRSYDVLVSDVCMPRMGGLELFQKIRQSQPELPVILMTATLDPQMYERAREMGTVRYLIKPVRMEQLARAVETCVKLRAVWCRTQERRARAVSR